MNQPQRHFVTATLTGTALGPKTGLCGQKQATNLPTCGKTYK
jgi:hypothetical protein